MHGHDKIIAMRKRGIAPAIVFINDFACDTDWPKFHEHATVQILPSETIEALDFRFTVGLTVSISGSTLERSKRIAEACRTAGADTVAIGCVAQDDQGYMHPGWAEIWRRTEGL